MASAISLYRQNDPYETLIANMIAIEREPQWKLKDAKAEKARMKGVMSDANSKISALHTLLKKFNDPLSNPFQGRRATVPENSAFTADAGDKAAYGVHSLRVEQLAATDTRVSTEMDSGAGSLRTLFDGAGGSQTFSIEVGSPTDADPLNRAAIQVTVAPTGTTDEAILKEIATAVNTAMGEAATAGTIRKEDKATASVVTTTTGKVRLSMRSGGTGYDNRFEFTDDASGGLLNTLGVMNKTVATGTSGGAVKAVGTSETDSALSSRFVLNGLTLYRSKNEVSDAMEGVTLSLGKAGGTDEEFTIDADAAGIKKEVESFITKYNDILNFIKNKSKVDVAAKKRGDFSGDSTMTGLRMGMRTDMVEAVTGQPANAPTSLADLGIKIADDGTLSLDDEEKLLTAARKDSAGVESLFSGTNGYATRLQARLGTFVGTDGVMDNRKDSYDESIKRLDKQIAGWDERLTRRETSLRAQFARMQEAMAGFQGQQQYISSFFYNRF